MQEDGEEVPTREADVLERLRDAETKHEGLVANLANINLPFIPVEIKSMRMLRELNLRGNALTFLPTEPCHSLRVLERLNMSYNSVSYLPENISALIMLRQLLLGHNELVELPDGLCKLPNLQELRLEKNRIETLPLTIGSLTGLEALYLAHNSIKLMPPQSVHMTALATLDLTGNPVEAMPSRMRRLDNMNALLHSKQKRQALISRANNVRLSVKAAIMRDVMNPAQQADR